MKRKPSQSVAVTPEGHTDSPPQKLRKVNPHKKQVAKGQRAKLDKSAPDYYSRIGTISAEKRLKKLGTSFFSDMAKKSHPRAEYHGGRPRKNPIIEPIAPTLTS